jgi:hypothetical protein
MSDKNIHTCHADCPCQTGGEPVSDFLEAQPETGQPIPDEAIEAGEDAQERSHAFRDDKLVRRILTAALPHLEAAKDKRIAELEAALFECARLAGEDTSGGVPTKPPLTEWAIRAVKELRQDYDEVEQ